MSDEPWILDEKYSVIRQLGEGGMGQVLLATHLQLDQQVAIKLLKKELTTEPIAVERFLREARAAARIQSDHVVRVFDVATLPDGQPYIVMEYLEGEDLSQRLDSGPLPVDEVLDCILQACIAIAEAHRVGVIHRDLKPGNLFLTRRRDGSTILKVVDFGISKLTSKEGRAEAALTTTTHMMGSPFYMSPEQLKGGDVDARTDVWALGLIMFELLTAEGPFDAPTMPQMCMQIMSSPARRLSDARPDLVFPPGIEEIIERCLAKEVDQRFPDAVDLAAAIAPLAPHSAFGGARAPSNMPTKPPTNKGGTMPLPKLDVPRPRLPSIPGSQVQQAAPPVDDGRHITASAWDTGGRAAKKKKQRVVLLAAIVGTTLVFALVMLVRIIGAHDSNANAPASPSESIAAPLPPPPTAIVVAASASAASSSSVPDAPSALASSTASSAAAPTIKSRPTAPTTTGAATGGGGGGGNTSEFGGRK